LFAQRAGIIAFLHLTLFTTNYNNNDRYGLFVLFSAAVLYFAFNNFRGVLKRHLFEQRTQGSHQMQQQQQQRVIEDSAVRGDGWSERSI